MRSFVVTSLVRATIVCFWTALIFLFLFLPYGTRFLSQEKSINLFIWAMIIDEKTLQQFYKETGIKVYATYYESNAELYAKLRATKGQGYDIVVPTDYAMQQLIQDGMLKPLDKSKLPFLKDLRTFFLDNYFDPGNVYSVPYYLGVYGLGRNKTYFDVLPQASWDLVFNKKVANYKICMTDGAREAILLAALYLYGSIDGINDPQKLQEITHLLIEQKKWVEVYTSLRVEELLASGGCPVAVGINADARKVMSENADIDFSIPREGSFMTIDSFVLLATSKKDEFAYKFINFLFRSDVIAHNSRIYGFCPPLAFMPGEGVACPDEQTIRKLDFFRNVLSQQQIHDVWLKVMSV